MLTRKGCLLYTSFLALVPFLILISSSFSEDTQIIKYGYSMFPRGFSMDALSLIHILLSKVSYTCWISLAAPLPERHS